MTTWNHEHEPDKLSPCAGCNALYASMTEPEEETRAAWDARHAASEYLYATVRTWMAQERIAADALAASTPKVLDGHSDGKRVRYVRHETRAALLADVLAMLETAQ